MCAVLHKFADVAAHAELFALGGNQNSAHIGLAGLLHHSGQRMGRGSADDIALFGLVQHDMADMVADFPEHKFRHQATFRS